MRAWRSGSVTSSELGSPARRAAVELDVHGLGVGLVEDVPGRVFTHGCGEGVEVGPGVGRRNRGEFPQMDFRAGAAEMIALFREQDRVPAEQGGPSTRGVRCDLGSDYPG